MLKKKPSNLYHSIFLKGNRNLPAINFKTLSWKFPQVPSLYITVLFKEKSLDFYFLFSLFFIHSPPLFFFIILPIHNIELSKTRLILEGKEGKSPMLNLWFIASRLEILSNFQLWSTNALYWKTEPYSVVFDAISRQTVLVQCYKFLVG